MSETKMTAAQLNALKWLAGTPSGALWVGVPEEYLKPLMSLRDVRAGRCKILRSVRSRSFGGVAITPAGRAALKDQSNG